MMEIRLRPEELRQELDEVRQEIIDAGFPQKFADIDGGRYGFTHTGLDLLEAIERADAVLRATIEQLTALVSASSRCMLPPSRDPSRRARSRQPEYGARTRFVR